MDINYFCTFLLNGIISGALYAVVGLGFALVYNTTRIFHIAYGVIYTSAAYIFYFFLSNQVNVMFAILFAISGAAILGYAIEKIIYRPLYRKGFPLVIFIISSIGAMIVVINIIALLWGNEHIILNEGISKIYLIKSIRITEIQLYQFLGSLIILITMVALLKYTRLGIILRAMRDDNELSSVFGIDIFKIRTYVFIVSSSLAATASCMKAYDVGADPYGGMELLLIALVALIIGGVGSFEGVIIGGFVIGILQAMVIALISSKWSSPFIFMILIILLIFRPQGILGKRVREV
jgi:branched-chain amino acid transport system permease protein